MFLGFFFIIFSIYFYFYLKTILLSKEFYEKILISCFAIVFFCVNFINVNFILEICVTEARVCKIYIFDAAMNLLPYEYAQGYCRASDFFAKGIIFILYVAHFCFFFPLFFLYSFLYVCLCLFVIVAGSTVFCTFFSFFLTIYVITTIFL